MTTLFSKIIGVIRLIIHLANPKHRRILKEVTHSLTNDKDYKREKTFVMMVGLSKSGKTYVVENNSSLRDFFRVSTSKIHDLINENFNFLKDDNSVNGKAYWERQYLTRMVRKRLINQALKEGIAIVNDSCNLRKPPRKKDLYKAKKFGYQIVLIWVLCSESELLKRLQEADEKSIRNGGKPVWISLHEMQEKIFNNKNRPDKNEADRLVLVLSPIDDDPIRIY
jgi:predicted kinase